MIKVEELFAEMKIVESDWAARAHLQGILIIGDWSPLLRGEDGYLPFRGLMKFAARGAARLRCKRGFVLGCFWFHPLQESTVDAKLRRTIGPK
jgi:hypothetical protein